MNLILFSPKNLNKLSPIISEQKQQKIISQRVYALQSIDSSLIKNQIFNDYLTRKQGQNSILQEIRKKQINIFVKQIFHKVNKKNNSSPSVNDLIPQHICWVTEVFATAGNSFLGGEDFDNILGDYCCAQFQKKKGINIKKNKRLLRRLKTQCERAQRLLSKLEETTIEVDSLIDNEDFFITISRFKFEDLCMNIFMVYHQWIKFLRTQEVKRIKSFLNSC